MQRSVLANMAKHLLQYGPKVIAKPLNLVPFSIKAQLLERILNLLMSAQVKDGELDFLQGRWVKISVTDLELSFEVSFDERLIVRESGEAEVSFSACSQALLLIAAAKEDPDTLFFQRRLAIEGDTELGLEVKNLLLSIEFDSMPLIMRQSITQAASMLTQLQRQADMSWA
ncbi:MULTISPECIES: ubiquinone anaerobic biosynthesis accessory factor UbiT [Shewanella]|uniref:ubiquinone anaerobic biosynthesis accessory factor UbiT n=1 Tax=Shewanella TaxID=22 RepID=UPI001EFCB04F|nr:MULTISPECIES: SCP2 sterol-binding domain-containing protein [Shewanella]MCG9747306.1 SCP2 sterol-binding domain-containing protein [Shewanella sp. Isolate8]MCL2911585.1 SCP2 sterol-binding domain-containing protein [Shewanella aquimarina]